MLQVEWLELVKPSSWLIDSSFLVVPRERWNERNMHSAWYQWTREECPLCRRGRGLRGSWDRLRGSWDKTSATARNNVSCGAVVERFNANQVYNRPSRDKGASRRNAPH